MVHDTPCPWIRIILTDSVNTCVLAAGELVLVLQTRMISTTSVRIADLATKVVHFVILMGIWRIDVCQANLQLC